MESLSLKITSDSAIDNQTNEDSETHNNESNTNIKNSSLQKEELAFYADEIKDFFFYQIESLYDHFIKDKNKFILEKYYIEKFQIESLLPLDIQNQLHAIYDFSHKMKLLSPCEIYIKLRSDMEFQEHNNRSDNCPICMENFYDLNLEEDKELEFVDVLKLDKKLKFAYNVIMLDECQDHYFHLECLINLKGDKEFIKCPICFKIYGIQIGEQPEGTMVAHISKKKKCSSYENCDTIIINYLFPNGDKYTGTRRKAYLPANDKGWEILGLLKICFDRKLTFKIGTSVTTGLSNTVVWSGIHHKSNLSGGSTNFGFPDEDYFRRVKEEIALRGVIVEKLNENPIQIGKKFVEDCKQKDGIK